MAWTAEGGGAMDWETPPELFAELDKEFGFDLDPCCTPETAKTGLCFTPAEDGLAQPWAPHTVYMNPPYGREIKLWMKKAREEADKGATVVCLVPARLDGAWWNETTHRSEVRFRRGRVNFYQGGEPGHAAFPGPIAVVVMRPDDKKMAPPAVGEWRTVRRP